MISCTMITYELNGHSKHVSDLEVEHAIVLYADHLMGHRLARACDVEVFFRSDLLKFNILGECSTDDYGPKFRNFVLRLHSDLERAVFFRVLAHEMVHMKQFAVGAYNEDDFSWYGEVFDHDTPYYERPWEVQAFALEQELVELYHGYHDA